MGLGSALQNGVVQMDEDIMVYRGYPVLSTLYG